MKKLFCLAALAATPLSADEDRFVASNMIATLYHELGHALVDALDLPIFGQEEDAADTLSALIIADYIQEPRAVEMAYDTAFGFLAEADRLTADGYEVDLTGVHGPDMQRFHNFVCIFYGADPDERDDIAEEIGLAEDRFETCPEEYEMADWSWGSVLRELEASDDSGKLKLVGDDDAMRGYLTEAVADWNARFSLPQDIDVLMEDCGEPNAFYDQGAQSVTMCSEYPADMRVLYSQLTE